MKTRLTELLGIKHPIIQAAMGHVSTAPLVSAASQAGAFGILANNGSLSPQEMRENIKAIKAATDKPFGVNFIRPAFLSMGPLEEYIN